MSSPVAVLVDGENIRADFAGQIYKAIEQLDPPRIRRVYQNAAIQNGWTNMPGWKVVHSGTGKNATDMLLCIEAVDMVLTQGITQVVIVSSDGDFSHLATFFRERGFTFIGIGEAKTAAKFRKACGQFITLRPPAAPSDPVPLHAPKPAPKPVPVPQLSQLNSQIVAIIKEFSKNNGPLRVSALGSHMMNKYGFQIKSLPEKTWTTYLKSHSEIYTLSGQAGSLSVQLTKTALATTGT